MKGAMGEENCVLEFNLRVEMCLDCGVLEGCRDQNGSWVIGVRSLVAVRRGGLLLPFSFSASCIMDLSGCAKGSPTV